MYSCNFESSRSSKDENNINGFIFFKQLYPKVLETNDLNTCKISIYHDRC